MPDAVPCVTPLPESARAADVQGSTRKCVPRHSNQLRGWLSRYLAAVLPPASHGSTRTSFTNITAPADYWNELLCYT